MSRRHLISSCPFDVVELAFDRYRLRSYGADYIARIHPLPMVRVYYSYLLRNRNEKHVRLRYRLLSVCGIRYLAHHVSSCESSRVVRIPQLPVVLIVLPRK